MISYRRIPSCRCSLVLLCFLSLGCQPEQKVESYTVEGSTPARQSLDTAAVLENLDHILVAIVPQSDKAWFFKLVAKTPAMERQRKAFNEFLATVKLAPSSADTPSWELPEGWTESSEKKPMRATTLIVPDSGGDLELAVSSLPLGEDWEGFLVPNVNRWLRQLRRDPLPKATLLKMVQQSSTKDGNASVFELSGMMELRPMGSKGGSLPAGFHGGKDPHEGLGIAPPPAASAPAAKQPPAASKALTYKVPEGWLPGKMSMMRKAAFLLPGGDAANGVTVTSFPAAPGTQMADVALNIQRWARQVGMASPEGEELDKLTESITVAGIEGTYAELTTPAEAATQMAIYVAMIERDGPSLVLQNVRPRPSWSAASERLFESFWGQWRFRSRSRELTTTTRRARRFFALCSSCRRGSFSDFLAGNGLCNSA